MKFKIIPPSKELKQKAKQLIKGFEKDGSHFDEILQEFYARSEILPKELDSQIFNLSPGTSSAKTFSFFLDQINKDLSDHKYYRDYSSPSGESELRETLSIFENINLGQEKYTKNNFVVTDGATGAISNIFKAFKKNYPDKEIIIPIPTYFVFKTSAICNNLKYKEVVLDTFLGKNTIDPILKAINKNTKMIILCHPNNPTGLCFSDQDLLLLFEIAKKNKIMILSDEVFFDLYLNKEKPFSEANKIALKTKSLDQLFVIKGFSKNYNLPGLRLGYLFTNNQLFLKYIRKNQLEKSFFATGSNFRNLFYIDCMVKTISIFLKQMTTDEAISLVKKEYKRCPFIGSMSSMLMKRIYESYGQYMKQTLAFYNKNYDQVKKIFGEDIDTILSKEYAFNTFIKIKGMEKVNFFDFSLNLFLSTGIMHDCGPCFGLSQNEWQKNPDLGYWFRISFSRDLDKMEKAINIFEQFKKTFLSCPDKFLLTNKNY